MTVQDAIIPISNCDSKQIVDTMIALMKRLPPAKLEYEHQWPIAGLYVRTLKLPAGCVIVGDVHATDSQISLASGEIIVWDEWNGARHLKAPFIFSSKVGTQRVGYTLTPVVWRELFETDETDLEKLDNLLRAPSKRKELTA